MLGNRIGTTASGKGALPNDSKGVTIDGSSNNKIGDGTSAGSNTIAFNGLDGVEVFGASTGNKVSRNSLFSNGGLGIDLLDTSEGSFTDVSNPNDAGDADSGPNALQNKPVLSSAKIVSGKSTIRGRLSSKSKQSYVVRFFSNPSGGDEGKKFIGQKKVTTGKDGKVSFTFSPAQKVGVGETVTATATGSEGTSEFSAPRKVVAA